MTTSRINARALTVWLIVALGTLSHSQPLTGQIEPPCANCGPKPATIAPIPVPEFQAPVQSPIIPQVSPPVETPVAMQHPGDDDAWAEAPQACIKIKTRVKACAEIGKRLEYQIKVENVTAAAAHNVVVKMNMPASVKVLEASPQVAARDPELQWNLGTIPGHGCHDIVVVVVPIGLADIKSCARVTYEIGQCVTTKVMQYAADGSADGRGGPGGIGSGGTGTEPPGGKEGSGGLSIKIFAPAEAGIGLPVTYKIVIMNKGKVPLYKVGATLEWDNALEEPPPGNAELVGPPGAKGWPKGLFDVLQPLDVRTLDLVLRAKGAGQFCMRAQASAAVSQNPRDDVNATDKACTNFMAKIPGVTLEMFDRDDPILKNGTTSYPITVRNQGQAPITNLQVRARIPDLLDVEDVRGPGLYRKVPDAQKHLWVEFETVKSLNVGETQTFEVLVKGKGLAGEAKFHVEMTADQLDKLENGAPRWVIEEENTTIVPDEETRTRIREINRKSREQPIKGTITSR